MFEECWCILIFIIELFQKYPQKITNVIMISDNILVIILDILCSTRHCSCLDVTGLYNRLQNGSGCFIKMFVGLDFIIKVPKTSKKLTMILVLQCFLYFMSIYLLIFYYQSRSNLSFSL